MGTPAAVPSTATLPGGRPPKESAGEHQPWLSRNKETNHRIAREVFNFASSPDSIVKERPDRVESTG
jgi:hypothetical protein